MAGLDTIADLDDKLRSGEEEQYLTFQLGSEELGINILAIKEIISFSPMTRIPMVPRYILGVMNVRGNVVPVVDLAVRFGKHSSPVTALTCIIIIEVQDGDNKHDIGIIVDSVEDVIDINDENMEAAPGFGANIRADYVAGIGKIQNRFIKLLNISRVLNIEDLGRFDMDLEKIHNEYLSRVMQRRAAEQEKLQAIVQERAALEEQQARLKKDKETAKAKEAEASEPQPAIETDSAMEKPIEEVEEDIAEKPGVTEEESNEAPETQEPQEQEAPVEPQDDMNADDVEIDNSVLQADEDEDIILEDEYDDAESEVIQEP